MMNTLKVNINKIFINPFKTKTNVFVTQLFNNSIHTSSLKNAAEEKIADDTAVVIDILDDLKEPELTEEEIMQKRLKARLPERVYKMNIQNEALPIVNADDFRHFRLRMHWARFGSQSKLNPGICWPTREKILETIEYDKTFEPSLQDRIRSMQETRLQKLKEQQKYEAEVDQNMANSDKWIEDYYSKIRKNEEKIQQLRSAREKLVEEISEYLGYDIDPKDPRFKEAVEQRDKERKKALKVKKQQESYEKMLDKLKKIAQQKQ